MENPKVIAAKRAGAAAFASGVDFHDNPYRTGPHTDDDYLYSSWEVGFINAMNLSERTAKTQALYTFRRAMRRHEKRARRLGFHGVAEDIAGARENAQPPCASDAEGGGLRHHAKWSKGAKAWLYSRAAEAVEKYLGSRSE